MQSCFECSSGKMSSAFVLQLVTISITISSIFGASTDVFEKIKAGIENAKSYLQTARDIADLVAKSLKPKPTQNQDQNKRGDEGDFEQETASDNNSFQATNLISTFFRLLGLDSKKITAVAVNSFIFFAQMISEFFKITPKIERAKAIEENDDTLNTMRLITDSENEKVQNLLKQAQDEQLPDQLIGRASDPSSGCVRLLLCKTSPIIWAAQKTLKNSSSFVRNDLTSWLPSKDEFEEYSDKCDDKHKDCELDFDP